MGGLFSQEQERHRSREEQARQSLIAGMSIEAGKAAEARTQAAEESRQSVFGMLGAPGTYDVPGTPAGGGGGTAAAPSFADIYQKQDIAPEAASMVEYGHLNNAAGWKFLHGGRKGVLDPTKYAQEIAKSSSFRTQSKLQAQAEQLLSREGEEWQRLEQGTLGKISEDAATAVRESMRELKNDAAKGGTARRAALNEAQKIITIQRANEQRSRQTWQANINLDQYVRNVAMQTQQSNQRFLDNLPGIRQAYSNTMNNLSQMMTQYALPIASAASQRGYQARAAVGNKAKAFAEQLIMSAGVMLVSAALPYVGPALGAAGSALGTIGGALAGAGSALAPALGAAGGLLGTVGGAVGTGIGAVGSVLGGTLGVAGGALGAIGGGLGAVLGGTSVAGGVVGGLQNVWGASQPSFNVASTTMQSPTGMQLLGAPNPVGMTPSRGFMGGYSTGQGLFNY